MDHVLYEDGDIGAPKSILDRNGQIALGMCKICQKAEYELREDCPGILFKVISGGQTGVDTAALLAASELGIRTGGFAPKGWLTEKGPSPYFMQSHGLVELSFGGYTARTAKNVEASDFTIILSKDKNSAGTISTIAECSKFGKSRLIANPFEEYCEKVLIEFLKVQYQIVNKRPLTINIAGNRESVAPGIEARVKKVLANVFKSMQNNFIETTQQETLL